MRLLILLVAVPLFAAAPAEEIRAVLDRQVADWNRGDVRAFMQGYDDSAETTYVGTAVVKGYQRVLERYLDRYPTRQTMGTVRFSDIDIRLLGSNYACVVGKFHLERAENAGGIFSLVLRKTPKGWNDSKWGSVRHSYFQRSLSRCVLHGFCRARYRPTIN